MLTPMGGMDVIFVIYHHTPTTRMEGSDDKYDNLGWFEPLPLITELTILVVIFIISGAFMSFKTMKALNI